MNSLLATSHATHNPFPLLENWANEIRSHPLFDRVSTHWKIILMDAGTAASVASFVLTFFTGSAFLCFTCLIATVASTVGSFYMRQFSAMGDLQSAASQLKNENDRLKETNGQLQQNNATFRTQNQTLQQTTARLTEQVTQLSLQVTQLNESAQHIRNEVALFQQQNQHLRSHVVGFDNSLRTIDQQILNSKALCEQISTHLGTQQQGLGQQLDQLKQYLNELRADNRVHQRIQELGTLQQQVSQAAGQLHGLQVQYAAERAEFEVIRNALVQLKDQFDTAIRSAATNFQANNHQLQSSIAALTSERERIHELINRHFDRRGART